MNCPHRTRTAWLGLLAALTCALLAPMARAAPTDAVESARALFGQAESDEDAERWSEALEKFRAIAHVKLTAGVRYHIALCEEHLGQLARALGDYREAEDQARLENAQDVLRIVGNQVAALDPRVPRLALRVVPSVSGVSWKVDGELVATALVGTPVPVDPGVHYVVATAPNRPPAAAAVTLRAYESRVLELSLEQPREVSPPPPPARAAPTTSQQRMGAPLSRGAGIATTALAVALATGGAAAFIIAGAERDSAVRTCALIVSPSPDACDWLKNRVRTWDFAAASAWGGALVTAATAVVLWAQPAKAATRVDVAWVVSPNAVGVRGRF